MPPNRPTDPLSPEAQPTAPPSAQDAPMGLVWVPSIPGAATAQTPYWLASVHPTHTDPAHRQYRWVVYIANSQRPIGEGLCVSQAEAQDAAEACLWEWAQAFVASVPEPKFVALLERIGKSTQQTTPPAWDSSDNTDIASYQGAELTVCPDPAHSRDWEWIAERRGHAPTREAAKAAAVAWVDDRPGRR